MFDFTPDIPIPTWINDQRDAVIELQRELVSRPALSPEHGASRDKTGEARKVAFLKKYLTLYGIDHLTEIHAPDDRVAEGYRPSLIARLPGVDRSRTLWIMAHTDTVPPGNLDDWQSPPYELRVEGDDVYGRGVEDNHQGLVSAILAARSFVQHGVTPACDLALLFVADEECGSAYGIKYILEHANPFGPDDLIIVPDYGVADGSQIEIAEKSIGWYQVRVIGKGAHGSMPHMGNNAARAAAYLTVRLDEYFKQIFTRRDLAFDPPTDTLEPTKREANVPNVNNIPGDDVSYWDCRLLPSKDGGTLLQVERIFHSIAREIERDFGVTIEITPQVNQEAPPPTKFDSPVVLRLEAGIRAVYGIEPRVIGIGGGTVAAPLRAAGLPCAVWQSIQETFHQPNESSRISRTLGDAKVFAHVALSR